MIDPWLIHSESDTWQCPTCARIECADLGYQPSCYGTPEQPHDRARVRLIPPSSWEDAEPTDGRELFR